MPFTNTLPVPKIYSNKLSEKTMKHYAWLISRNYFLPICYSCGKESRKFNLHVHHKNKNRWDNRICNLIPQCAKCHFVADFPKGRLAWFKGHHHTSKTKEIFRMQHLGKNYLCSIKKLLVTVFEERNLQKSIEEI